MRRLAKLSVLASSDRPADEAVQRALPLLRDGLAASDVFLVYGDDDGFRHVGTSSNLELTDVALWLIHRDLTTRGEPNAFELRDGRVADFRHAGSRRRCYNVAALLPVPNLSAEMLVARGAWPRGFGASRLHMMQAMLPSLALVLERRLNFLSAEQQRQQLSALANITRVMSESEDLETVLTSIARTIAVVTGIDYVSIDIVDSEGKVDVRCFKTRAEMEELSERWKRGANKPDPVREAVISTRRPMLFQDSQNDDRIPASGRNFFIRTLIRSTAVFPLLAKEEVLGVLSVASHRPLEFTTSDVDLLEGLAAQTATAIKGIQLYRELDRSRKELRRLNEQLQERMGIEHHLARTDALTGIPNRRFIDETVETECARSSRYGQALSAVMIDLDHLKEVNDGYGHPAGDDALRFVARLARESCRQTDVVGRYGGDEFLFVLPSTASTDAVVFAERFRRQLAEGAALGFGDKLLYLTASLGVAQWDEAAMKKPSCLIQLADRAMYAAKAAGRNRTMVADGETARAA